MPAPGSMPLPDGSAEYAPAVARNRQAILAVLGDALPARGSVLEVASGTGEHAAFFAAHLPGLTWQPTDHPRRSLASIEAHRRAANLPNLLAPVPLDVEWPDWPIAPAAMCGVVAINMVHIAPWSAAEGLIAGAARVLAPHGRLVLYGPYREADQPLAASNAAFDADLKARDPAWGLRTRADIEARARAMGLAFIRRVAMPANNLCLVFERR